MTYINVDTRPCRLYRIYVLDPRTNYTTKCLGYIGETLRLPIERLMEHIAGKWWADTFVGCEIDDTIYDGKEAVQAAEKAAVEAERPLYNDEFNRGNPDRIPIWEQQRQREERDRAKGVATRRPVNIRAPKARPTGDRPTSPRPSPRPPVRSGQRQRHSDPAPPRWLSSLLAGVAVWLVTAAGLWWVRADDWHGFNGAQHAGGWSTGLLVGMWLLARRKRRPRKRRR